MKSDESLHNKKEDLEKFLNSEKLNQKTDDDKTLLLCIYKHPNKLDDREYEQLGKDEDSEFINAQTSNNSESSQAQSIQSNSEEISLAPNFEDIQSSARSDLLMQNHISLEVDESSDSKLEDEKQ